MFDGSADMVSGVRSVEAEPLSADVRRGLDALRRLRGETEKPVAAPIRRDELKVETQTRPLAPEAGSEVAKPAYRWTHGELTSAEAVMPGRIINVMA
jgi:hypothetical protein